MGTQTMTPTPSSVARAREIVEMSTTSGNLPLKPKLPDKDAKDIQRENDEYDDVDPDFWDRLGDQ